MGNNNNASLARNYAALIGIVLVAVGVLGFISNPIVADPRTAGNPIFHTDTIHNIVHLGTGALALYIAFGLPAERVASGVIGFGALYVAIFVLVLLSPTLFGILQVPANAPLHVLHAAIAVVSLGVGYMARNASTSTAYSR